MNLKNVSLYFSIASLAVSGIMLYVASKIAKKIDDDSLTLSEKIPVAIEDEIIKNAVNERVEREVKKKVSSASEDVYKEVHGEIRDAVLKEVANEKKNIADNVKSEIEKKINGIDIDDLRREVISKAKDKVAEKFDGDLNGILDRYNSDLSNISKIYSSIASSIGGNTGGIKIST